MAGKRGGKPPFRSKAQWGWAFASGKKWAKRWARKTPSYKALPRRVRRRK